MSMNFMQIVQTAKAVFEFLPAVVAGVTQVEAAFPSTAGAAKLDIVKSVLSSAYNAEQEVTVAFESLWPTISGVITALVKSYHDSGLFTKKPAA